MDRTISQPSSLSVQDLSAFVLPPGFRGRPGWYVQLWWIVQGTLFRLSPQFMYGWRRFLLRVFGARIGINVLIRPTARVTYPWKLEVGDFSWIGDDVILYTLGSITIGSNVVVSQRSYICAAGHDYRKSQFDIFSAPVRIEDGAWVATDVYVGPGVTVARGAVVGARSSVFRDVPAMMICVGSPARPIKPREVS